MLLLPISFYSNFFGYVWAMHCACVCVCLCVEYRMDCHFFNSPNNLELIHVAILVWQRHVPFSYQYVLPSLYIDNVYWGWMNVVRINLFCSVVFSSVRFCLVLYSAHIRCVCVYIMIVTHVVWYAHCSALPFKLLLPLPCMNLSYTTCTRMASLTS